MSRSNDRVSATMLLCVALPAALCLAVAPARAQEAAPDKGYDAALQRCEMLEQRNPITYHIQGWELIADTRDPRAIQGLAERYAKPRLAKEQYRYLVAQASAKGRAETTLAAFDAWRAAATAPEDAWLWYIALGAYAKEKQYGPILEVARTNPSVFLRAAAVEALAAAPAAALSSELQQVVAELAGALPKKPAEKAVMLGALSTAVLKSANVRTRTDSKWQRMALALVATLDDETVPRSARLVVARHLAKALAADTVALESDYWRGLLSAEAAAKKAKDAKKQGREVNYVKPKFFGVEASGERIAYVIDLSDSMLAPIEGLEKQPGGPRSGPKPKREKGALPTEDDIPWHLVKTRFDLAREHLKISLQRLGEEQSFTVVTFGTKAELLDGITGMVKATPGNVKKAIAALDGIRVGGPQQNKPYGVLAGDTNLHSGVRLAFRVRPRGLVEEFEHVELSGFEEGCDTIFVLSDGDPTTDDYPVEDGDYGDYDVVTDRESKEKAPRGNRLNYPGPYANWNHLLEDVRRMNLFREVEIHCISIGDAQPGWLQRLAELGLGTLTKR
jgi:hypothetical protein